MKNTRFAIEKLHVRPENIISVGYIDFSPIVIVNDIGFTLLKTNSLGHISKL